MGLCSGFGWRGVQVEDRWTFYTDISAYQDVLENKGYSLLFTTHTTSQFFSSRLSVMAHPVKATPLVAPGHTRPVTHLSFSQIQDDGSYLLVSSCKDGNPMLREWTGDWIGTFLGHKGAVWSTKLSPDSSRAATGSADFTA